MEVSPQSTHIGHWIKVLDHDTTVWSNRFLEKYGLTRSSWYIIYHINEVGEILQRDLQDVLGIESGSMAILVDGLVKKGWLKQKTALKDRRYKAITLSPEGLKKWKKIPNFIEILREKMMKGITKEEEAQAVSVLKKCWNNLNEKPSSSKEKVID